MKIVLGQFKNKRLARCQGNHITEFPEGHRGGHSLYMCRGFLYALCTGQLPAVLSLSIYNYHYVCLKTPLQANASSLYIQGILFSGPVEDIEMQI